MINKRCTLWIPKLPVRQQNRVTANKPNEIKWNHTHTQNTQYEIRQKKNKPGKVKKK